MTSSKRTVISHAQFRPEVVTLVCVPKTVSRGMRSSRDPCELRSCPLSRSTRATRSSSDSFFGAAEAADLLATRAPAPLSSALRDVRCDLVPRVRPVADVAAARSSSSCMWRRERLARRELAGGGGLENGWEAHGDRNEDRTAASNDKQVASPPYSLNLANLPAL